MNCYRCTGLMQRYYIYDPDTETGNTFVKVWQCLNCGEIVDQVILKNRQLMPQPAYGRVRLKIKTRVGQKIF